MEIKRLTNNSEGNITFINSIDKIDPQQWTGLHHTACPFLHYDFFKALEASGSVSIEQGWQPHHLVANTGNDVTAVMPMYVKSHSWGEYVFDWAWAEAFERYGIQYYPKLVATIPFTPVSSEKVFSSHLQVDAVFEPLIAHCQQSEINSWHILYCPEIKAALPDGVYERNTVQFHWFNRGYETFDAFLETFTSRKRKNTRKERQSISQQNIRIRQLKGREISSADLEFFYVTYQMTYLKRGHQPHLTYDFFKHIVATLSDNMLLIIASDEHEDVACALFFYDDTQLYGRYWGCTHEYSNLHFELCYYQGIEFCIQHKLERFNPGTQGEHKIQRGFEPVLTHSYHWVKHEGFKDAIKHFCLEEQAQMLTYQTQCRQLLPFKK